MDRRMLALALVACCVGAASACIRDPCPAGFEYHPDPWSTCGFSCWTPPHPQCLPQWTYNLRLKKWIAPRPATWLEKYAAMAHNCGGYTGVPCPAIACVTTTAISISGPLGCSQAESWALAVSYSESDYKYAELVAESYDAYFIADAGGCQVNGWSGNAVGAWASSVGVFSYAVAQAYTALFQWVCTCCLGNSVAYTAGTAQAQAVAVAQAEAFVTAAAAVFDCRGNLLSYDKGFAQALAESIQVANTESMASALALKGGCVGFIKTNYQQAVAKASACVIANAYAYATTSYTPGASYACSDSVTITGDGWTQTCNVKYWC